MHTQAFVGWLVCLVAFAGAGLPDTCRAQEGPSPAAEPAGWTTPVNGLQARLVLSATDLTPGGKLDAAVELRAAPGRHVVVPDISANGTLCLTSLFVKVVDADGNELPLGGPQTGMGELAVVPTELAGERVLRLPVALDLQPVMEYCPGLKEDARDLEMVPLTRVPGTFRMSVTLVLGPHEGYFGMLPGHYPAGAWAGRITTPAAEYRIAGPGATALVPWGEMHDGLIARLTAEGGQLHLIVRNFRRVVLREEGYSGPPPTTSEGMDRILYRAAPPIRVAPTGSEAHLHAVNLDGGQESRFAWPLAPGAVTLAPGAQVDRTGALADLLPGLPPGRYRISWSLSAPRSDPADWNGKLASNRVAVEIRPTK